MRTRRLLDEAFKHPWGPAAVAALVLLGFLWVALWALLLVGTGVVDMANTLPDPVKVLLIGVTAAAVGVACLLRGIR